jgi:hypothetical protein
VEFSVTGLSFPNRQDLKMLWFALALSFFNTLALAAPVDTQTEKLGLKFEKRWGSLPTLTLSDATYRADSYNSQSDVSIL